MFVNLNQIEIYTGCELIRGVCIGCLVEDPVYPLLQGLIEEVCEVLEDIEAVFLLLEMGVEDVEELDELDEEGIEIVFVFDDKEPICCVCCVMLGDDKGETSE